MLNTRRIVVWAVLLGITSSSLLVSFLAPVPGSIGITEVLTIYFLDPALTARGMVVGTLLRFLCAYGLVVPGVVLLANAIRKMGWQQVLKCAQPKRP